MKESRLVDGHINSTASGLEQEICFLRWFYMRREEDRAAAGSADPEITVPAVDIFNHFGDDGDLAYIGPVRVMGEHGSNSIGMQH